MESLRRSPSLTIAIPASLISDTSHLREETYKIGLIGRAAAIFRVDGIVIYPDLPRQDQSRDSNLIYTILSYMETPQYLRRHLFPLQNSLRYAGILPPLRTPHHPKGGRVKELRIGDFREGVVLRSEKSSSMVDIGVDRLAILRHKDLRPKSRITVKITGMEHGDPEASLANREEINIYWGFKVSVSNLSLGRMIRRGSYNLVVCTSRHGKPVKEALGHLEEVWCKASDVLLAFGSPNEGLAEILKRDRTRINDVSDLLLNTIPRQGVVTVRTEEALYAALSIINLLD